MKVLAREVKELWKKQVSLVKLFWNRHGNEEAMRGMEELMRSQYPNLFSVSQSTSGSYRKGLYMDGIEEEWAHSEETARAISSQTEDLIVEVNPPNGGDGNDFTDSLTLTVGLYGISSSLSVFPLLAIVSRNPLAKIGSPTCPIVVLPSVTGVALGIPTKFVNLVNLHFPLLTLFVYVSSTDLVLALRLVCDQVDRKVAPLQATKAKVEGIVKSSKKDKKRVSVDPKKISSALKVQVKILTKKVQALKDLENKKEMETENHQLREKVKELEDKNNPFDFRRVKMKPLIEQDLEAVHFGLHNLDLKDEDWQESRDKLLVPLTTPPKETSIDATPLQKLSDRDDLFEYSALWKFYNNP
ncbi:receptor-like protein kinase [Gossypium australe]|uniref:Receptor-like protein kinase n=1 Tax=Gossypium australe TaxID=47621 RepID=A0A5B6WTJ3_9ROSI|nr:receptor-like protein kinase [Gossypium australe]